MTSNEAGKANVQEARTAFLHHLVAESFVPEEIAVSAVNAIAGPSLPISPQVQHDANTQLGREIEQFAAIYWSLSSGERSRRWLDLSTRKPEAPRDRRLEKLGLGLKLQPTENADPDVDELSRTIRELYVLPPRTRAVRRAHWLADHSGRMSEFIHAAIKIREKDPLTASLLPEFLSRIADHRKPLVMIEQSDRVNISPPKKATPAQQRKVRVELKKTLQPTESWRYIWVGVVVIGALVRLIGSAAKDKPDPTYYQPPRPAIEKPVLPPPKNSGDFGLTFSAEQIKSFESFDPSSGQPEPLAYDIWKAIGSPKAESRDPVTGSPKISSSPRRLPRSTEPRK